MSTVDLIRCVCREHPDWATSPNALVVAVWREILPDFDGDPLVAAELPLASTILRDAQRLRRIGLIGRRG